MKKMTKKEIKDLAKELLVSMNKTPLEMDASMSDEVLDVLSAKVVARLVQLEELTNWLDRSHSMTPVDWDYISMTHEEELLSELAKLMTLMNLYTDKEEYEKCSLLKTKIKSIKRQLKKHEDDEV